MDSHNDSNDSRHGQENNGETDKALTKLTSEIYLRLAAEPDLIAINDLYNYYVLHSTCTYQEQPEPICDRHIWFHHHGQQHPVIVAVYRGMVVGWGSLSPYHQRTAYRHTVENSVYVHPDWHHRGIGSLLLQDLIKRSRELGHRAIIAAIDSDQTHSIRLHAKYNFQHAGRLQCVGLKFGQWLDAIYMELLL
jgi:L-amino acid N-acyltransferase YncA